MELQQITWDDSKKVLQNLQKELYVPTKRSSPLVVQCYGNPTTSHDLVAAQENATDRFKAIAFKANAQAYEIIAVPIHSCEWEFELPNTYSAHAVGLLYGSHINADEIKSWTPNIRKQDSLFPQLAFDPLQQRLRTMEGNEYKGIRSSLYVGHNNVGNSHAELKRNILGQLAFEARKQNATGCEILALMSSRTFKDEGKEWVVVALLYTESTK